MKNLFNFRFFSYPFQKRLFYLKHFTNLWDPPKLFPHNLAILQDIQHNHHRIFFFLVIFLLHNNFLHLLIEYFFQNFLRFIYQLLLISFREVPMCYQIRHSLTILQNIIFCYQLIFVFSLFFPLQNRHLLLFQWINKVHFFSIRHLCWMVSDQYHTWCMKVRMDRW